MARELIGSTSEVAAKPPPPPPPAKARAGKVAMIHEREDFEADAHDLAQALGWRGEPTDELNGTRVEDARAYFSKVRHEIHISVHNEKHQPPTAESVCAALGITLPERVEAVEQWIADCIAVDEAEEAARTGG